VPNAPPLQLLEVTTYYATNRKQGASAEPANLYGPQLDSTFRYGRATITIPPTHTPGNLEMPSLWKLEREADPNKHFLLKSVVPLEADAARREMAEKLQGMSAKSLLLFVHGYNTSFAEAALRTAQLAHDLRFPGMAFFYSWPSAGSALSYWQDEETAQLSEGIFEDLLGELTRLPVTDIYIVAHSMGNRIVTSALRSRVDKKEPTKQLRELLLAAPDINAELFRTVIAPKLAAMQGTRTTVYASSSDLALKASKIVHGFQRVGDTIGGVFVYPRFDTIDASGASTMTRAFGHSYLMDSASVLKDIQAIIQQRIAAKQRGLVEMGAAPNAYWRLP
jgi:esterase/lipase superfamily enzyme